MKKTIKQWLETLPSPIKEKALANLDVDVIDSKEGSLSDALFYAFEWDRTKEGDRYWNAINKIVQAGDFDLEEKTFPREVYVDDINEARALRDKIKRICLGKFNWQYLCVQYWEEEKFNNCKNFEAVFWKYIAEIPKEKTLIIETKDGQSIEISEYEARNLWLIIN